MQTIRFDSAFTTGIRQDDRAAINTQGLIECRNVAATQYGLRPFRDLRQPITNADLILASIVKSSRTPQLFRGKAVTLLVDEDQVFSVTESPSGDWSPVIMNAYDWTTYNWSADTASTRSIPTSGDGEWHFVDLWDSWMLFNGVCTIFKFGFSSKMFVQDSVTIKTGATFQDGKLFYAGFNPANVNALADWDTYLATQGGDYPDEAAKLTTPGLGANCVWWSSTGMGDAMRFFSLNYMKYLSLATTPDTGFTDAAPYWLTIARQADSGWAPMPYTGDIVKIQQLGSAMVVYGATGTQALVPLDTQYTNTFGHREIAGLEGRIGLASGTNTRAAQGGNENVHAFIDESRDLWIVTPDLKAEKLGYRQLFSGVDDLQVHYDPHEQEFHFTGADRAYRLSRSRGMARSPQIPTSVSFGRSGGTSGPMAIYSNDAVTTAVTVQTEWFDGGMEGVPQILKVRLVGSSGWTVTPKFYRTITDTQQTGASVAFDSKNEATLNLSGARFSLVLTHADRAVASADSLEIFIDNGQHSRSVAKWQV